MSEAHKARGTGPPKAGRPWTAQEDELVLGEGRIDIDAAGDHTFTLDYELD